ncbi:MAG: asparagine synthase (glutamine-hydrolyzing) [Patescibacteria group bacterium]
MCGIIGLVNEEKLPRGEDFAKSLATLSKRGPDDSGVSRFRNAILGHTRLAIVDLTDAGHQPMKDAAREQTIVFNGEIYNYPELREELMQLGHTFVSHSDTEVILKAYTQWGKECTDHLDGQFAFAIWDDAAQRLFLARDHFGEKPLYLAETKDGLLFASEIKALLATGLVEPEIDPVSIDNYLALSYVPPWRSMYKHITPLEPAHRAVWQNGKLAKERYWQLTQEPSNLSREEAASKVREIMEKSVKSRMIADVEVGAFLSGGMDSSIVVRLAQKLTDKKLKTFSAGFEDTINELPYAREVAELAGTEHTEAQMHEDLLLTFKTVTAYFDEPFADSSNVPTTLISKLARQKVKVVLSGDGGDELFWGYGQYTRYRNLPKIETLYNTLLGKDAFDYYRSSLLTYFSPSERGRLLKDHSVIEKDPTEHIDYSQATTPLQKINLTDFYMGLPGDMLAKVDRASMSQSLEVRSPFLNSALAQLAYNLPAEYKSDGRRGKVLFKDAFGDLLPQDFFTRKKQGFGAPVFEWLQKPEVKKYVEEIFNDSPRIATYLNIDTVRNYVERLYAGDRSLKYKVWLLVVLETWIRSRTVL